MPIPPENRPPLYTDWEDRYEVVRKIGVGGFAEVYAAYDHKLGRDVALKIVAERPGMSGRVVREIEAASSLSHPGIVSLYDYFSDGDASYLVWELVAGDGLERLVGELDDAAAVAVAADVLEALVYAHSQGVVHRDIKPQNIMLDSDGQAKVMDFGIARLMDGQTLTTEGDLLGTVAYMSPEQAEGRRAGPASDVYSTAIVLYELLAGQNPLRGATAAETLSNVAAGRFAMLEDVRPDLPQEVSDAVDLACSPEAAERPSAAEFAGVLRAALAAGRLRGRRRRLQRLLRPLRRGGDLIERVAGSLLAGLLVGVVLTRLPAYPESWTLPLVALSLALWFVVPSGGLAWSLGLLVLPLFDVSLSIGVAYLVAALLLYWLTRRSPAVALWPVLGVALVPVYGAFLAPAAAAALGRLRGPLAAAWAGAGTLVYLLLWKVPNSPFTGYQGRSHLAGDLESAGNPVAVVVRLAREIGSGPALLQMAVWAALAALLPLFLSLRSLEHRLWAWSLTVASVWVLYRVVPVAIWHHRAPLTTLLLSVCAAAVVIGLPVVLGTGRIPEEQNDERPEVD